jgi:hypothetical protein
MMLSSILKSMSCRQEEQETMRENLLDGVDVEDDAFSPLVLILANELFLLIQLANLSCKLNVARMARTRGEDLRLQRNADQCEVAHHIKQLVARRLVFEMRDGCLTRRCSSGQILDAEPVTDAFDLVVGQLAVNNHNCVVKIATTDETCLVQHFNFMKEAEGAARCKFGDEFLLEIE